jgi:hypothetical protein
MEMRQISQHMMECLLTSQEEAAAQATASLKELKEGIKGHMVALLEGLRSGPVEK